MTTNNQWSIEQNRVDTIKKVIESKKASLEKNTGHIKGDILEIRKNFWNDVTVNLDEPDDVIETYASIKQQNELLSERERSQGQIQKQLKILNRLHDSPYFGRIDFHEDDEAEVDSIYIGIASLMDQNNEDFLIYDWRAPISSLYYDYGLGAATYKTPGYGDITGEIKLKRQYIIRNGLLKGMFDTGVTIGDELLQEVLGNNANTQMKSIVATIQREQNQIIRSEGKKYLVVQGVAGSGKTSAALQRVAYLLYRYRNTLQAEQIMLFSPNTMFNSYVSTVLPELGEENMEQRTLQQYIDHRLGKNYKVEDPYGQMEYILSEDEDTAYQIRKEGIRFKASLAFKDLLDKFVDILSREGMVFKNISFRGEVLISADYIKEKFYSFDQSFSIPNRIHLLFDWLKKEMKKLAKIERNKDWVIEEMQLLDKEDYLEAFKRIQQKQKNRNSSFDDHEQEEKMLAKEIVNRKFKPIMARVKRMEFIDHLAIYKQFFNETKFMENTTMNWENICIQTLESLQKKVIAYEDTTPFLYLMDQIEGRKSNTSIRHIFIDEAQDYSPFQFAYIKQLFPHSQMTILGDYNQAIYSHTQNAPSILTKEMYGEDETEHIVLRRSYRSTRPIVEFTMELMKGGEKIEPFNRDGALPTIQKVESVEDLHIQLLDRLNKMESNGHKTIAIICKTAKESKRLFESIKEQADIRLIQKETLSYDKGILIIPAYLAKGIEFDGVILFNVSNEVYKREDERKLLYTACTRAMHELHLLSLGEKSKLLDDIPEHTYKMI
ncbi:DNA helicase IV [Bacillus carboniphilus]|uniref:DNA helicase IV n=1 Tax=Bacillus carboniphilus TaxID=86663 RepID=A0ABP3FRS7_9BACI